MTIRRRVWGVAIEAREAYDRGLALAPANLDMIESKVTTFLPSVDGSPGAVELVRPSGRTGSR